VATTPKPLLTPEDYIGHSFHLDCDFIDGKLEARNLSEKERSRIQRAVLAWFVQHASEWSIDPFPEMRVQTSATRYRVADIAVLTLDAPDEQILTIPPLIVVEILSPEDRRHRYDERLGDYRKMGVPNIWVIDSVTRTGFDWSNGNWEPTTQFFVLNSPIRLSIADLALPEVTTNIRKLT
jgi:Uma2 family endonuclease